MTARRFSALKATMILSCLVPFVAKAQTTGLEDMVGARAGQGEQELQRRGYANIRSEKGDDRAYSYWWNDDRRQCVTIATMNGRYDSIQPTTPPDCRKPASLRPNPNYGQRPATRPNPDYERDPGYSRPPYPSNNRPGSDGPVVDGRDVEMGLVCFGDGTKDGLASGSTWTWNDRRNRYDYGRYTETKTDVFDASLMIQTWNGGGRIRLPRSLVPPLNSDGHDGWWDLYDLYVSGDEIRGTYRLNGLNKPKVVIDRRTGRINVQGLSNYGFRGSCDTIGHTSRRF